VEGARAATPSDQAAVCALARQGTAELRVNRGGAIWHRREGHREPLDEEIAEALSGRDRRRCAVVGTIDETVVGYGLAVLEVLHDERLLAVVTDLYVDGEARGIGIGEAMMDHLVTWARQAGAVGIDALALPGDRHTKNFFETFGLTARAIVVHRSLEGDDEADAS
jgi:GNAT superfamily N-acetyltransferase